MLWLVGGGLDGQVEQRLVLDHPLHLDAAAGRHDHLRPGVVDADRQLVGREPSEHHRVDGADPGTGQHGDDGLGDHRQVDDDRVTLGDTKRDEGAGEPRHVVPQLAIGEGALHAGDRRVVDQGGLLAPATVGVAVEGVVTRVELAAGEPPVERRVRVVEDSIGPAGPVDGSRRLGPEGVRVLDAAAVLALVRPHGRHGIRPAGTRSAGDHQRLHASAGDALERRHARAAHQGLDRPRHRDRRRRRLTRLLPRHARLRGTSARRRCPAARTMYRLMCGTSLIKLIKHAKEPKAVAPPGGINGATGYRYWTISVSNIAEMVAACEAGGYKVVVAGHRAAARHHHRHGRGPRRQLGGVPHQLLIVLDRTREGAARPSTGRRTAGPRLSWGRGSSAPRGSPAGPTARSRPRLSPGVPAQPVPGLHDEEQDRSRPR